jgi:hypothetical protein
VRVRALSPGLPISYLKRVILVRTIGTGGIEGQNVVSIGVSRAFRDRVRQLTRRCVPLKTCLRREGVRTGRGRLTTEALFFALMLLSAFRKERYESDVLEGHSISNRIWRVEDKERARSRFKAKSQPTAPHPRPLLPVSTLAAIAAKRMSFYRECLGAELRLNAFPDATGQPSLIPLPGSWPVNILRCADSHGV